MKSTPLRAGRVVRVAGGVSGVLGLLTLAGWVFDVPVLATFGQAYFPMAPSTAVFFLVVGGFLVVGPISGWRRVVSMALAIAATGTAALIMVLSSLGLHLPAEHLGLDIAGSVAGAPVGYMSPLTAFVFLLEGVALAFLLSATAVDDARARTAAWFAGGALVASGTMTVAYLAGGPLLYDTGMVPPALTTTLAFLASSTGLLAWARPWRLRTW